MFFHICFQTVQFHWFGLYFNFQQSTVCRYAHLQPTLDNDRSAFSSRKSTRHPMFHLSAWSYGDLGPPSRSSIHCFNGGEWDDKWDAFLDSEHSRKCLPGITKEMKTHNMSEFVAGINVNNGDVAERAINRCSCLFLCAEICSCTNNDAQGHGTHVAGIVAGYQYRAIKHAIVHGMLVGTIIGVLNAMDEVLSSIERQIFQMSIRWHHVDALVKTKFGCCCCWLLLVCCWLFVGCWFLFVCCWLFVGCVLLFVGWLCVVVGSPPLRAGAGLAWLLRWNTIVACSSAQLCRCLCWAEYVHDFDLVR